MPSQHLGSRWDSSSNSSPHVTQSPPHLMSRPVDMFPSIQPYDVQKVQGSRNSSMCTPGDSRNSSPEFMFPNAFESTHASKGSEDWVHLSNTTHFEPLGAEGRRQSTSSSASMPGCQDIPDIHLPSDSHSWNEMNLWVMDNLDMSPPTTSNSSRSVTPFESAYYLSPSSAFTTPHSSVPHSPSISSCRSISPLSNASSASSLSRHTSPNILTSSSPSNSKGKGKICSHCKATSTPLWRRDPATHQQLCNACGLYLQQRNKLRPQELIDADADEEDDTPYDPFARECSHCHTRNTSVWRRNTDGSQLCNACGVYRRLRGKDRPLSLRRNRIKPRTKKTLSF
jgi:hypothetical protein